MPLQLARSLLVLSLLALGLGIAAPAQAQPETREGIYLQNQILQLRAELDQLRNTAPAPQGYGGGSSLGGYAAPAPQQSTGSSAMLPELLDRIARLEEETRELRGALDQATNQLQVLSTNTTKQIGDLTYRIEQLEAAAQAQPAQPQLGATPAGSARPTSPAPGNLGAAVPPPPPPPPAQPRRTPELALQEGNAALARRDYTAAESAAQEVVQKPGPRQLDGKFLLAQAYAGEHSWQKAAVEYYEAYSGARTGARAPEALLGLSNALLALNDKKNSCDTLDKLHAEFPNPRTDIREAATNLRVRAGCH